MNAGTPAARPHTMSHVHECRRRPRRASQQPTNRPREECTYRGHLINQSPTGRVYVPWPPQELAIGENPTANRRRSPLLRLHLVNLPLRDRAWSASNRSPACSLGAKAEIATRPPSPHQLHPQLHTPSPHRHLGLPPSPPSPFHSQMRPRPGLISLPLPPLGLHLVTILYVLEWLSTT